MDDRPARRRLGCWGWLLILTGMVGVAAVAGALWLRSFSDLDSEVARARTLDVAMDWQELGLEPAPPEHRSLLQNLQRVTGRGKLFDTFNCYDFRRNPFVIAPAGLDTWTSGVDADLDVILLGQSAVPGPLFRTPTNDLWRQWEDSSLDWDVRSSATDLLTLRSLRGSDDPQKISDLFARLAFLRGTLASWPFHVSTYTAEIWQSHAIRYRQRLDPASTAATALTLTDHLESTQRLLCASHPFLLSQALRADPERLFRQANIRLPSIMMLPGGMLILPRLGRKALLGRAIDTAAWISKHGLPTTYADIQRAAPSRPPPGTMQLPTEALSITMDNGSCLHCRGKMIPIAHSALVRFLRCTTGLRLLAAECAGEAWPIDPCDPSGKPLRPITRDGAIIGAYSFGEDGLDGHGDIRTDLCWALRGPLGSPKASDPPKAP